MDETAVTVRSVRSVGPDTIAVEFESPADFVAEPGQFVQVFGEFDVRKTTESSSAVSRKTESSEMTRDADDVSRTTHQNSESSEDGEREGRFYTLSSPDVDETFEVTVAVDPEGTLGPWLADREPGDEVTVTGPFGDDYYEGEDSIVVLSAGPGVGPAVAVGERALADGADVTVVYRDDQPVHEDRLAALAAAGARVVFVSDDVRGAVRSLTEPTAGVPFVYGFSEFCGVAVDALEAAGFDVDAAKVESFGPAP